MNLTTERTQHTPGPWEVSPYGNITSKSGKIASVEQMPSNYESEKQANARIIAAAPDLLVALEQCVPIIVRHANATFGDGVLTLQVARSAIAKAKGETT